MSIAKLWFPVSLAILGLGASTAAASSHRDAPAIAQDQYADNTDVYSFVSPENPDNLVIIASYMPLLVPFAGPNFYQFSDNVAYDLRIDNDGDARTDMIYRFIFKTSVQNGDTFLYNTGVVDSLTDENLNVRQVYDVIRVDLNAQTQSVIAADVPVAPWNVGDLSFPNGSYEGVALGAVAQTSGVKLFAGPRDDSFFVDFHVFDLLGVGGFPGTDGFNVMSLVLEVPIADLTADGTRPADVNSADAILGIHATASRQRKRVLRRNSPERNRGRFVQISRLGFPLVSEIMLPLKAKDPVQPLASRAGSRQHWRLLALPRGSRFARWRARRALPCQPGRRAHGYH